MWYTGCSNTWYENHLKYDNPWTLSDDGTYTLTGEQTCPYWKYRQTSIWLQISIAVEFLIFSCRTPSFFFLSRPSAFLFCSVMICNIMISLICNFHNSIVEIPIVWEDILKIWLYDVTCFLILDTAKVAFNYIFERDLITRGALAHPTDPIAADGPTVQEELARASQAYASGNPIARTSNAGQFHPRASGAIVGRASHARASRVSRPSHNGELAGPVRPSLATTLRPSTPGNYAQVLVNTDWTRAD